MEQNCIFCQIISGEKPAEFVYKGQSAVAFKDIKLHAPIHISIVPKKHIRSINDLEEGDREIIVELNVFRSHLHLVGGWDKKQV